MSAESLVKTAQQLAFDVEAVRKDFPILFQEVNGKPLVYLDNAATTQKPEAVINAISDYYRFDNSNVHRGAHALSDRATEKFEDARNTLANFINSPSSKQLIWTRGTTESINLVANTWAKANLQAGDTILVAMLEHHSNIVPWQLVAEQCGAKVVPIPVDAQGAIDLNAFDALLDGSVKLVAFNHVSNALGTINPAKDIIAKAKSVGATTLLDGAQAIAHFPVDVQDLDCDFYCFSGHKLYGPTGIGALWGSEELLNAMPPFHGGGEMIEQVSFEKTTFNKLPYKFEAGTPDIAGVIGLGAAVGYLNQLDRQAISEHEKALLQYTHEKGDEFSGLTRVGTAPSIAGVYSFLLDGTHPADVGTLLDQQGIAVRTGHHCAQPIMAKFNIPGTVRASFSMYNTFDDIDRLFDGLYKVKKFLY